MLNKIQSSHLYLGLGILISVKSEHKGCGNFHPRTEKDHPNLNTFERDTGKIDITQYFDDISCCPLSSYWFHMHCHLINLLQFPAV